MAICCQTLSRSQEKEKKWQENSFRGKNDKGSRTTFV
jgi:hypothetical protein